MQIPRVLVMGATGRIGGILRRCWPQGQAQGQVLWQARRASDGPGPWVILDPLAQPAALARAASGCAAILCLAGVVPGRAAGARLSDNAALAEAAVRAGAAVGARVLLASSAAVYGNRGGEVAENAPLAPRSDYGRAKAEMEARGAALGAGLGVAVTSLRIGNVAGLDAILGGWQPGFRLDRLKDGRTPRRSYIGPRALARVLGELVAADALPDALNLAAPGMVEMGALLDAAGLAWTPRAAPQSAIAELCLSTRALARFTTLPEATSAAGLVAEWQEMKEQA